MEFEVDIRRYISAIARRWHWIFLATCLAALLAGAVSLALPKEYTARASVLVFIRQTGTQIGVNQPLVAVETIDVSARRGGLIELARSETIEGRLPADLIQTVVPSNYRPGLLVQQEYIKIDAYGDLILFSARARTPQYAKALADAWATTYVATVQELYTDQHSEVRLTGEALQPFRASSPQIAFNILAAALGALALSSLLALLAEIMGWSLFDGRGRSVQHQSRQMHSPNPKVG